ncbi:MAG: hypothetical protein COB73_00890 [Flavobacteriaceae bacterium]|nr:MAG: hypothetical protein COB73_00890 [Flavobacteriaceae bacterium]
MEFRTHPILSDLKCNEDGTVIKYHGKKLALKIYATKTGQELRKVIFKGAAHSVAKVVCECWNGMRDRTDMVVIRKDHDFDNDHYSNLKWGFRGGWDNTTKTKLSPDKELELVQLANEGMNRKELAKKFKVCLSVVYRTIKKA